MANVSADQVGLANYVQKLNARRLIEKELRREGYDYWAPEDTTIGQAPFPSGTQHPVTFIYEARRPNGTAAILAGVEKDDGIHIYRYRGTDNGLYVKTGYWDQYYTVEEFQDWYEITDTPLQKGGERLQAITVNGVVIINNGIDVPLVWKFSWVKARPLYQFRESGIAYSRVLAEYFGMAVFGNVTQTNELDLFSSSLYGQTAGSKTTFHNRIITSQINDIENFAASLPGEIEENGLRFYLDGHPLSIEQRQEVVIPGAGVDGGNLYARAIKVFNGGEAATVQAFYKYTVIGLQAGGAFIYNGKSYQPGESFFGFPGVTGGTFIKPAITKLHKNSYVLLDTRASTAAKATISTAEAVNSTASFQDLADDGHPIENAIQLQGQLIVCRPNDFVALEYTGDPTDPFRWQYISASERGIHFKNTLINIDGRRLFYAGREQFFILDSTLTGPVELPLARLTDNIFFDAAFKNRNSEIFCTHNPITNEIWICFKDVDGSRSALCYNYVEEEFNTTDMAVASATKMFRPGSALNETWFAMGFDNGVIGLYGLVDRPLSMWSNTKKIFYRRNTFNLSSPLTQAKGSYNTVLKYGMGDFGDAFNEKTVKGYVLLVASSQPGEYLIKVAVNSFENAYDDTPVSLMDNGHYTITDIKTINAIPMWGVGHLLQETITIEGKDNPVEIIGRIYNVAGVKSQSFDRSATA